MDCVCDTSAKTIVFSENGRRAIFENKDRKTFSKGQVDGCLIRDNRERCDAFLRSDDAVWLIELKGRDVQKAASQIVSTCNHLSEEFGNREIVPVIVASKCPAIAGQQKYLKQLKKLPRTCAENLILRSRVARVKV